MTIQNRQSEIQNRYLPLLFPGLGNALGAIEPLLEDLGCARDG